MLRQNRVEIDMDAIRNNYRILRDQVPADVEVMPVIKANAYGHGMLETADALSGMGASHFAVALPEEGIGLRTEEEADALAAALASAPHVRATGIYTHFADADNPLPDGGMNPFTRAQLKRFCELRAHFNPDIPAHVANSAMSLLAPEAYFNMIREGISLYGYPPVPTNLPFTPALSWYTEIVHVKRVNAGESIGYGCTFIAPRDMLVATAAVGYGDGYHRAVSNRGAMLVHGRRAPIVGRVCMDQTMLDVTDIPGVQVGDETVILGCQGGERIDAVELASWAGTISYEVLLAVTARVPRVYLHV